MNATQHAGPGCPVAGAETSTETVREPLIAAAALSLRPLGATEHAILEQLFHLAAAWWEATPERPHPSLADLLNRPEYAIYIEDWGRSGDRCIVATVDETVAGGIWCRLFKSDRPSLGFIDEQTPELGLAVFGGFRRAGLATALVAALVAQARLDGRSGLSLEVTNGNPARHVYEAAGFRDVRSHPNSRTMGLAF